MKRLALLLLLTLPAQAQDPVSRFRAKFGQLPLRQQRVWKARIWGEEAVVNETISAKAWSRRTQLKNFPWSETLWMESAGAVQCTEVDANGLVNHPEGADQKNLVTRHRLESGQWMLDHQSLTPLPPDPQGNLRMRYTPPGGSITTLTFDPAGDLREARFSNATLRFSHYIDMAGAHLPQEETLSLESLVNPESYTLVSAEAASEPQAPPPPAPGTPINAGELPLSLVQGRWTQVSVGLGGKSHIFLLDSGASDTTLDMGLAQEMGMPRAGQQQLSSGMFKDLCWLRSPAMDLGGITLPERTLLGLNLRQGPFGRVFHGISGILGRDVFARFVVIIDYRGARLRLVPRDEFRPQPDDRPVDCRREGAGLSVRVSLAGQSGYFGLDTGNGLGIVVQHMPGQNKLVSARELKYRNPQGATFGSGTAATWPARADFAIGPFVWKQAPLIVVDESSAHGASLEGNGNVGVSLLRHFRVSLDVSGGRVWLAQTRPFRTLPQATTGMRLDWVEGEIRVAAVVADSPAARAGLVVGDTLLKVNGSVADPSSLEEMLQETQLGEIYDLEVRRAGQTRKFRLSAAAL